METPPTKSKIILDYLRRQPGRLFVGLCLGFAFLMCWAVSVPDNYFTLLIVAVIGWMFLAAIFALRLIVIIVNYDTRSTLARDQQRWLTIIIIVVVTITMVVTGVPLRARFEISQRSLNQYALLITREIDHKATTLEQIESPPPRIGFFSVERVERFPGGMRFIVSGAGSIASAGLAYSPQGPPPIFGNDYYWRLEGAWFGWIERS